MVPNTTAAAEASSQLERELASLAEPSSERLGKARRAWQSALLSWKRLDAFRVGPISESNSLMRVMFWPVRTPGIDALLQGSQAIDDASIDAMGVDRRGLFALEYLLFAEEAEEQTLARFAGVAGERRVRLARALAANVSLYAQRNLSALGDGVAYGRKFAEEGQDSVNRLVAQLVYTVDSVSASRFARTARLVKDGRVKPAEIEGGLAQVSQRIALTQLRATEELYLGREHGLCQLVETKSPPVASSLRSAFTRAVSAVADLGGPLEQVARDKPEIFEAAAAAVKKLERALEVDLASTLGVTSTFATVDGD
jgi:predicted lipoprotein